MGAIVPYLWNLPLRAASGKLDWHVRAVRLCFHPFTASLSVDESVYPLPYPLKHVLV